MKSAYDLAMERMEKEKPSVPLSEAKLAELREIESQFRAKIAERRTFLDSKIREADFHGKPEEAGELRAQLARDLATLESDLESKKARVRAAP